MYRYIKARLEWDEEGHPRVDTVVRNLIDENGYNYLAPYFDRSFKDDLARDWIESLNDSGVEFTKKFETSCTITETFNAYLYPIIEKLGLLDPLFDMFEELGYVVETYRKRDKERHQYVFTKPVPDPVGTFIDLYYDGKKVYTASYRDIASQYYTNSGRVSRYLNCLFTSIVVSALQYTTNMSSKVVRSIDPEFEYIPITDEELDLKYGKPLKKFPNLEKYFDKKHKDQFELFGEEHTDEESVDYFISSFSRDNFYEILLNQAEHVGYEYVGNPARLADPNAKMHTFRSVDPDRRGFRINGQKYRDTLYDLYFDSDSVKDFQENFYWYLMPNRYD